jgi:hypothetical protein
MDVGHAPASRDERLGQHLLERDARHLGRVLHGQEQSCLRALPRRERQQVLAIEGDAAAEHLVARLAHQHVRQRRLARAIRPHHRVHLAAAHDEVDPLQDLLAAHAGAQAIDDELVDRGRGHGSVTRTSPSTTVTT